ncbi:MAG TPA: hypothetical protein VGG99_08730 [Acetobacteraceae bacterium]
MSGFIVQPLTRDELRAVYPLIREAMPSIGLTAWLAFARPLLGRRATQTGIIAARRAGRAFPCGLFCYRVDSDLANGRMLIAEHFVAVDLLDPKAVLAALVAELDALGQRLGCDAVRSVVHAQEPTIAGGLVAAGHAPEASLMLKPLRRGPACDAAATR